jgi:drug/metabolite transporter (DMT)-like permease
MVAVVFSGMVVLNILNGALFLRTPVEGSVLIGAVLGLAGICLVFRPQLASFSLANHGLFALLLCLAATQSASLGNILSVRNQRRGLPVMQSNAWGMSYGALFMILAALATGRPFTVELSAAYLGSLGYLSIFGSVIAFGCYLTLVGRIGAGRAAYASLLFPLVALGLSTLFEGYRWSAEAALGVALILGGNFIALRRRTVPTAAGCRAAAKA